MTRARATLLLLGLFGLGVLCGSLGTGAAVAWHLHHGTRPERLERAVLRQITRRLDLDRSQRELLEGIVSETHRELGRLHDEMRPRVQAVIDRGYAELRPALRPDQQHELDRLRDEMRERLRRHDGPPPPF